MKAERLTREFADREVVHRDDVLLLARADALALVSRASEEGVPILAIDGLSPDATMSSARLERLADFSSGVAEGHGCWQAAEACIREHRNPGTAFSLALGDDPVEVV